jgi:hypothetical protein
MFGGFSAGWTPTAAERLTGSMPVKPCGLSTRQACERHASALVYPVGGRLSDTDWTAYCWGDQGGRDTLYGPRLGPGAGALGPREIFLEIFLNINP